MTTPSNTDQLEVSVMRGEGITDSERDLAEQSIRDLAERGSRPVIFARVKLTKDDRRPPDERSVVQGTLDMSGAIVRAQVAAGTVVEALDALGERLGRRMRRIAEQREDANVRPPATPEGQWRSGDLPSRRPTYFTRPEEDRTVVRRKSFTPETTSIEDALFDLDVLDHRFFLFTDEDDEMDSMVFESADGPTIRRLDGGDPPGLDRFESLAVDRTPAAELTVDDAERRLDISEAPFVFFRRADTGRGAVLYRRYDGHYGLVEPAS